MKAFKNLIGGLFRVQTRIETPTMRANRLSIFRKTFRTYLSCGASVLAMLFMPIAAHAAPWESGANAFMDILQGPLVTTLAVCAVVFLGLAALFGKLEMKTAGGVIAGIVLIRGAPAIVDFFESSATG